MINLGIKFHTPVSRFALLFFLVVVILTGAIAANIPLYDDDMVFANVWGYGRLNLCSLENYDPLNGALVHREMTNGRFGDMWTPLIMLIPRWLYGILYGGGLGVILIEAIRIAQLSFSSTPNKCIWLCGLSIIFFPWIDVLYTRAVFWNYFPAIIFSLIALQFFISSRKVTGWRFVGCLIASLLSGCWHELMPVILLPSGILYCLLTRKITYNQWVVASGMTLGMLFVISAPSFFYRPDQLPFLFFSDNQILLSWLYVSLLVFLAIVSILSFYLLKKPQKQSMQSALLWALLLPIIPSSGIMVSSLYEPRMCLFALILVLIALFFSLPSGVRLSIKTKILIGIGTCSVIIFVLWQLIFVAYYNFQVRKASEAIIDQAVNHPTEHIYFDLRDILVNDKLYLFKTLSRSYINSIHTWDDFAKFTGYHYTFNILPPALKDFDLSKAEKISDGYYYYDSYLLADAPCDSTAYAFGTIMATFGNEGASDYRFIGTYFEEINGYPLLYLLPYQPIPPHEKPKEMKITELNLHPRIAK